MAYGTSVASSSVNERAGQAGGVPCAQPFGTLTPTPSSSRASSGSGPRCGGDGRGPEGQDDPDENVDRGDDRPASANGTHARQTGSGAPSPKSRWRVKRAPAGMGWRQTAHARGASASSRTRGVVMPSAGLRSLTMPTRRILASLVVARAPPAVADLKARTASGRRGARPQVGRRAGGVRRPPAAGRADPVADRPPVRGALPQSGAWRRDAAGANCQSTRRTTSRPAAAS